MKKTNTEHTPQARWAGNKCHHTLRQFRYPAAFRIPLVPINNLFTTYEEKQVDSSLNAAPDSKQSPSPDSDQILSPPVQELIAQLATCLWRIKNKAEKIDSPDRNVRSVCRHAEAALDVLVEGKIEIQDLVGQKYITGMAQSVLAFQPEESIREEVISETIKPTIYYQEKLIQKGEIVVSTPKK